MTSKRSISLSLWHPPVVPAMSHITNHLPHRTRLRGVHVIPPRRSLRATSSQFRLFLLLLMQIWFWGCCQFPRSRVDCGRASRFVASRLGRVRSQFIECGESGASRLGSGLSMLVALWEIGALYTQEATAIQGPRRRT